MWWEYVIIFVGLALAAGYVLWFFTRMLSGKGGCGSAACKCDETEHPRGNPLGIKSTPIVSLDTKMRRPLTESTHPQDPS